MTSSTPTNSVSSLATPLTLLSFPVSAATPLHTHPQLVCSVCYSQQPDLSFILYGDGYLRLHPHGVFLICCRSTLPGEKLQWSHPPPPHTHTPLPWYSSPLSILVQTSLLVSMSYHAHVDYTELFFAFFPFDTQVQPCISETYINLEMTEFLFLLEKGLHGLMLQSLFMAPWSLHPAQQRISVWPWMTSSASWETQSRCFSHYTNRRVHPNLT